MTRIAIVGAAGRMGRTLIQAVDAADGAQLTVATERPESSLLGADAGELAGVGKNGVAITDSLADATDKFDVVVDFTAPIATMAHLDICLDAGKKMVIGT
ncbi:MAG: 4-hydroxy-tetrahydrodipicolinate reductase, partial [Gammaproteobacteria bacterium]|nr:4-hydroxy-tetrahydrodipicolinate reductase [Gammaproteobacteria bacterium]